MVFNQKINSQYIGLFSDIHIGLGQDSNVWHQNILDFAKWTVDVFLKRNITEIIIPGDIFHNRNEISVNTLSMAKEIFEIFKDFKVYISTGNHDCYYKDRSDINSISLLDGWNNITVVDKQPLVLTTDFDKKIALIPWGTELTNIPEVDICFGHFEINSFKVNAFKTCDHGMDSSHLLDKCPYVISGHFHHRDHRKYSKGDILYVGSPYQQNFGDIDSERGIYIFDLKNNKYEFIENNISPKHYKISLSQIVDQSITSEKIKEIIPNNMISLSVDVNFPTDKLSLLISKLQKLNPKFFRTDYKHFKEYSSQSSEDSFNVVNISQNIHDFVQDMDVEHKEDICSYLENLYNKLAS